VAYTLSAESSSLLFRFAVGIHEGEVYNAGEDAGGGKQAGCLISRLQYQFFLYPEYSCVAILFRGNTTIL
jgi:hypothetical protein